MIKMYYIHFIQLNEDKKIELQNSENWLKVYNLTQSPNKLSGTAGAEMEQSACAMGKRGPLLANAIFYNIFMGRPKKN